MLLSLQDIVEHQDTEAADSETEGQLKARRVSAVTVHRKCGVLVPILPITHVSLWLTNTAPWPLRLYIEWLGLKGCRSVRVS